MPRPLLLMLAFDLLQPADAELDADDCRHDRNDRRDYDAQDRKNL